ncbi:MAG: mercury methylation ferredoxin HgcB [Nitrospiraceae bacterium]|nr:mercury methylation ferredoxin HgcB [Nitrospiraceae bacterium]
MRYLANAATLGLSAEKCVGCGMCLEVCPHDVFTLEGKKAVIRDLDACMECGACAKNCPVGAVSVRSGVGCASAIIKGMLTGGEPTCDCGGKGGADNCC